MSARVARSMTETRVPLHVCLCWGRIVRVIRYWGQKYPACMHYCDAGYPGPALFRSLLILNQTIK